MEALEGTSCIQEEQFYYIQWNLLYIKKLNNIYMFVITLSIYLFHNSMSFICFIFNIILKKNNI